MTRPLSLRLWLALAALAVLARPAAAVDLQVGPASLTFFGIVGTNPVDQQVGVAASGTLSSFNPAITATTTAGGNWLAVSASPAGTFPNVLTIQVHVTSSTLAAGDYAGTITVTQADLNGSPATVAVSLKVIPPAPYMLPAPAAISVSSTAGEDAPSSYLNVRNVGSGQILPGFLGSTTSGGNWLAVGAPMASSFSPDVLVRVDYKTASLGPGNYQGVFTATAQGATNSPLSVPVTLTVTPRLPTINSGGIVNGASFTSKVVAPGEIVSAFGADFGPPDGVQATLVNGRLPTSLGGIMVSFDSKLGALYFVNANQINIQAPFQISGKSTSAVQVFRQGLAGPSYTVALRAADPGIFVAGGRPAILNLANHQVLSTEPAAGGDILVMFATGLGLLDGPIATGQPASSTVLLNTAVKPTVTVGGVSADVLFSGLAPGFVGLYQVNFRVPTGLKTGDQPVVLTIAGAQTEPLPLAVR